MHWINYNHPHKVKIREASKLAPPHCMFLRVVGTGSVVVQICIFVASMAMGLIGTWFKAFQVISRLLRQLFKMAHRSSQRP